MGLGLRVSGLGLRVWGSGFRVNLLPEATLRGSIQDLQEFRHP